MVMVEPCGIFLRMDMICFCGGSALPFYGNIMFPGLSLAQSLARSLGHSFLSPSLGRRVDGWEEAVLGKSVGECLCV